jgi:hypothetical protein
MRILGTTKIRGVCDISSIGLQVVKGKTYYVDDAAIHNNDVQTAMRLGFISCESDAAAPSIPSRPTARYVTLKNACNRTINFSLPPEDVSAATQTVTLKNARTGKLTQYPAIQIDPGQTITVKDVALKSTQIQAALANGVLQIEGSAEKRTLTEGNVRCAYPVKSDLGPEDNTLETNEEAVTPTVMSAPKEAENVKAVKPHNLIDSPTPDPVQAPDPAGPRRKAVIWNPANNTVMKKPGQSVVWIPGKTGKPSPAQTVEMVSDSEKEVRFVDQEQDAQRVADRMATNPDFKPPVEQEIVFADQKQEAERVAKHPVLGQQEGQ